MFNPTSLVINAFIQQLTDTYKQNYGLLEPEYPYIITFVARLSLEKIANSDAPYHDLNHTILVTGVGQEILIGKHMHSGGVSPQNWLNTIISLLCHDIGYIRGICMADGNGKYQIDAEGNTVSLKRGATDAGLTDYHVDRSQLFVQQRFGKVKAVDVDTICKNIEYTRFPVPDKEEYQATDSYPGLVRAADLIGQMADIDYPKKAGSLFTEFIETGTAKLLGYETASDLKESYPSFFWQQVSPLIQDAILYLRETQEGKQWVANLYANVFFQEHKIKTFGTECSVLNKRD
jgi:hypothetical protein